MEKSENARRNQEERAMRKVLIIICVVVVMAGVAAVFILGSDDIAGITFYSRLINNQAGTNSIKTVSTTVASSDGQPSPMPTTSPEEATVIKEELPDYIHPVDFKALTRTNNDIVAWLICDGTVIDYPVVQGKDNDYYLTHLFDRSKNILGTIFVDYSNNAAFSDRNTTIYGHHMKSGAMFASLVNYKKQSYYDMHPVMYLITPTAHYKIEIFSAYVAAASEDYRRYIFANDEEYESFLADLSRKSDFKGNVQVTAKDKIITLSTCTYDFDDARYVVHGKLVEVQ